MKDLLLNAARRLISWTPRRKTLGFLAQQYLFHLHNHYDANFHKNGEARWLKQILSQIADPVVFDVGANVGHWSSEVLKVNPASCIHAFEPLPATFERLKKHFELDTRVICNLKGVGDKPGQLEMKLFNNADEHNSIHGRNDRQPDKFETISIVTLDDYCAAHAIDHIHFLKIDTEGHEVAVLHGAAHLLNQKRIDAIQLEYGSNYILARTYLRDVFDMIDGLPYQIYRIMPSSLHRVKGYHEHLENFFYCNYAIVRNDINPGRVTQ